MKGNPKKKKRLDFKKMRIQKRLQVIILIVSLFASLSGSVSVALMAKISYETHSALNNYGFATGNVASALVCVTDSRRCVRDIVNYADADEISTAQDELAVVKEKFQDYYALVQKSIINDNGEKLIADIDVKLKAYQTVQQEYVDAGLDTNKDAAALNKEMITTLDPAYDSLYDAFLELLNQKKAVGAQIQNELLIWTIVALTVVVFMIAFAIHSSKTVGARAARSIAIPMEKTVDAAKRIVNGDLDVEVSVDTEDEVNDLCTSFMDMSSNLKTIIEDIKYLLGEMAQGNFDIHTTCEEKYVGGYEPILAAVRNINRSLSGTLSEINDSAKQFASAAGNMADASVGLAEGATDQASAIEELFATADTVTGEVERSNENVNLTSEKMADVGVMAGVSREKMNELTTAMSKIDEASNAIADIVTTIEEIATQTNLLSLNASIEAARAGEAGKGFAVVAGEIGKLANDSGMAVNDTRNLIKAALDEVQRGNSITAETTESLMKMVESIEETAKLSDKVKEAAATQIEAMEEIDKGIEQISSVVQNNSAAAEETSAMSEQLSAQADTLENLISGFKLRK